MPLVQQDWHFLLPPPLPPPGRQRPPEGSWWGFPSFLLWGPGAGGLWREPTQFRNFDQWWGCPFALSEGHQGPLLGRSDWWLQFLLTCSCDRELTPSSSLRAVSHHDILYFNFTRCDSLPSCSGAQGATLYLLWALNIPEHSFSVPWFPSWLPGICISSYFQWPEMLFEPSERLVHHLSHAAFPE